METFNSTKTDQSGNNTVNFIELTEELTQLLKENDVTVKAYNQESINHFSSLLPTKQKEIIENLGSYIDVCYGANKEGISLKNTKGFLKYSLSRIGMYASDCIYDSFENGDVVEAYNLDHIQVFRSVIFLELCNYTIADVLINEWFHLYGRDEAITKKIISYTEEVLSTSNTKILCDIPKHNMVEKFSSPRGVFECHYKFFAPLFSGPDTKNGYLGVIKAFDIGEFTEQPVAEKKFKLEVVPPMDLN